MNLLLAIFISAALFLSCTYAELTGKVMQSYGGASHTFVTHVRVPSTEHLVSVHLYGIDRQIATGVNIRTVRTAEGVNVTSRISTDGKLGFTKFTLVAKTNTGKRFDIPGSLDVLGVRLSGEVDNNNGITGEVYSGQGETVRTLADCKVAVVREKGAILKNEDLSVVGNTLRLKTTSRINVSHSAHDMRVMRRAKIAVDCPCVSLDGETAEHEIEVHAVGKSSNQVETRI